MEKELMVMMVEGGCPFARNSHMKVGEVAGDGTVTMFLEDDASVLNAFGLVHAGAICGLVETTGGMAIFNYLDPRVHIVLNTILDIRFIGMPRGRLTCEATVVPEEVKAVKGELAGTGRADKTVDVKVLDSARKLIARAQATFRLMPTPEEFKDRVTLG